MTIYDMALYFIFRFGVVSLGIIANACGRKSQLELLKDFNSLPAATFALRDGFS